MGAGIQKNIEICITKTAVEKFQTYLKISRNTTQTQIRKQGILEKELEKMRNDIKQIKKGHYEQKIKIETSENKETEIEEMEKGKEEKIKIKYRKRVELKRT